MTEEEKKKWKWNKNNIVYYDGLHPFNIMSHWVIRTKEETPRYIELILTWDGVPEYALVYNIHYARVWKGVHPPYRALNNFKKYTGIDATFQEVPEEAYYKYKDYEAYFNGQRELTEEEELQLKQERDEYKREHFPVEDYKEISLKGKRKKGTFDTNF